MIDPQDTQDGGFLCGVWCVFWLQKEFQPPPVLTRPPLVVDADAADDQAFAVLRQSTLSVLSDFGRVSLSLPLAPLQHTTEAPGENPGLGVTRLSGIYLGV